MNDLRKKRIRKAAAIAMALTMLTSTMSVAASAENVISGGNSTSSRSTSPEEIKVPELDETECYLGPAIAAYPLEEGLLSITTGNTGSNWTQHWITPYETDNNLPDTFYTLEETTVDTGMSYTLFDAEGNVLMTWIEEVPPPTFTTPDPICGLGFTITKITPAEWESREVEERRIMAENGEIDYKLGYKLLDSLYEEANAYTRAADFYKKKAADLKETAKEAGTIKDNLTEAFTDEQEEGIDEFIAECNREASYFTNRAKSFKSTLKSVNTEIDRLLKALDAIPYAGEDEEDIKLTYLAPAFEGESRSINYKTTWAPDNGFFGFWSSYQLDEALDVDNDDKHTTKHSRVITELSGDVSLLITLSSNPGLPYELSDADGRSYYVSYIDGKVYTVDEDGNKLSRRTAFKIKDALGRIAEYYSVENRETVLQSVLEEALVYETAEDFYEVKAEELKEIVSLLKDYRKQNKDTLSKEARKTLNSYINVYNKSASYYTERAKTMKSLLKTATKEGDRLFSLVEVVVGELGHTGEFGFWRNTLKEGNLYPIYMFPERDESEGWDSMSGCGMTYDENGNLIYR